MYACAGTLEVEITPLKSTSCLSFLISFANLVILLEKQLRICFLHMSLMNLNVLFDSFVSNYVSVLYAIFALVPHNLHAFSPLLLLPGHILVRFLKKCITNSM